MSGTTGTIRVRFFARYAELVGLHGIKVERPDDLADAWSEVLGAGKPAVLEAVVDPEIPPLPPHITFEQAKHFAQAVIHGDANRRSMVRNSLRQMLDTVTPGR